MNIVVIGQTSYDLTCKLDEELTQDRKYRFDSDFRCPGGPAFNAACLLGKWGKSVCLVSRINDDPFGLEAKKIALKENVNLDYLIKDDSLPTPYSFILVNEAKRTIFNVAGNPNNVDYNISLSDLDYILTDGHEDEISFKYFERFPQAIKIMDGGSFNERRYKVAQKVDYLIVSSQFAQGYTGEKITDDNYIDIFEQIENINKKYSVITIGEKGLIFRDSDGMVKIMEPFRVKSVDSTGAGDIFHGSFTYYISEGLDYKLSLKLASKTAALSTKKIGGYTSLPEKDEVTI